MKILSHTELGIVFAEQLALLGVREGLSSGLITDLDPGVLPAIRGTGYPTNNISVAKAVGKQHAFHMAFQGACNEQCGSVGCIGGYMALIMGVNMVRYVNDSAQWDTKDQGTRHSAPLEKLFFPPNMHAATTQSAIQAIDNFLSGNTQHPWDSTPAASY